MKTVVLAMACDGLKMAALTSAEDQIMHYINTNEQRKDDYIKQSCDYQDNVVSTVVRYKADALVLSDQLNGNRDILEIVKEVKSAMPDITIVMLLLKKHNVGDLFLAQLVMLGVYNWMSAPWHTEDIANAVITPKRLSDVEAYMPKLVSDKDGKGFATMVVRSDTSDTLDDVHKEKSHRSSTVFDQNARVMKDKDVKDINTSTSPNTANNAAQYHSLFSTPRNNFSLNVSSVRTQEVGDGKIMVEADKAIETPKVEPVKSESTQLDTAPAKEEEVKKPATAKPITLKDMLAKAKMDTNTSESVKAEPKAGLKTESASMEEKETELVADEPTPAFIDDTKVAFDKPTKSEHETLHLKEDKAEDAHLKAQLSALAALDLSGMNTHKTDDAKKEKPNPAETTKADDQLDEKVELKVKSKEENASTENKAEGSAPVVDLSSRVYEPHLELDKVEAKPTEDPKPVDHKAALIQALNDAWDHEINVNHVYANFMREHTEQRDRQALDSALKYLEMDPASSSIWDHYYLSDKIYSIGFVSMLPEYTSLPEGIAQGLNKAELDVRVIDFTKNGSLISVAQDKPVNQEITFEHHLFKDKIDRFAGITVAWGVNGYGVEKLFDLCDHVILVLPSDTSVLEKLDKTLLDRVDQIVVEPAMGAMMARDVRKKVNGIVDNVWTMRVSTTCEPRAIEYGKYYKHCNSDHDFANDVNWMYQVAPLLKVMAVKKEVSHE